MTSVISESLTPPTITTGAQDTFGDRSTIDLTIPFGTTGVYVTDAGALWTDFNTVTEIVAVGDTFVVDYITYEVTSITTNTIEAIFYDIAGGTVVDIPATVSYAGVTYSVTSIGLSAFQNKGLTSVVIPDGVTSIGQQGFQSNQLTSITIPNSVTVIGVAAFIDNDLMNLAISNQLTIIEFNTFSNNNLTTITIPNSVTSIGDEAFGSNQLTSVIIPNSVTNLGIGAFEYNLLTSVTISENLTSLSADVFSGNQLTNVTIPDGIITIDLGAVENNELTAVTIPSNVTSIGDQAFRGNPLNSVTSVNTTPPSITTGGSTDTFNIDRSGIDLIIPIGTTGVYVTDAGALWTDFNSVTEAVLSASDFQLANDIIVITTTEEIRVTYSNNVRLENYTIYSMLGAEISTGKESNITTGYLASGIDILKLDFDKGTFVKKGAVN